MVKGPPGPDRPDQVASGDPAERKRKKSKSKKSTREKHVDPVGDRAALEEESARALMLLSASALHENTRAPYYNLDDDNDDDDHDAIISGQNNPRTAQTLATKDASVGAGEEKRHRKKRKQAKGTRYEGSEGQNGRRSGRHPPSAPTEELPTAPVDVHPLDEERSDDDLVQEYENARSNDQLTPLKESSDQALRVSARNNDHAGSKDATKKSEDAPASPNNETKKQSKTSSKKRKRQVDEPVANPIQNQGLPIDPKLHAFDALPPSANLDALDTLNAYAIPELPPHQRRKRKRAEQASHDSHGEFDYNNSSNANGGHDSEANAVQQTPEEEIQMFRDFDSPGSVEPPERNVQSERNKDQKSEKVKSGGKGGFTAEEIAKLDHYRDQYCATNDLSEPGFNHLIQSNVKSNEYVSSIFNEIQELFPNRTRSSVQRFCRRRFHNFHARGVWTPEEDADLKAAVALKGTSWKAIGELLGRFNEDCRDRYRNYLAPSAEHRNRDAWTETEVINLSHSVLDCIYLMKRERQRNKEEETGCAVPMSDSDTDREAEDLKLINWQTVSDMMVNRGTPRSRIQCSFKWSKIKRADRDRYLKEMKQAQNNLRDLERGDYTANNMKRSTGWRLKAAAKQVMNMKSGDKYDLLNGILDSGAPEEDNIPWRYIGNEAFRERWSFSERKAGWFALKKEVEGSENMNYSEIIQRLLADLLPYRSDERWNPVVDGFVEGSPIKRRSRKRKDPSSTDSKKATTKKKKRIKKDPRLHDTDPSQHDNEGEYQTPPLSHHTQETIAAEQVRAAPPVANMTSQREGHDRGSESPDSLFDEASSPLHVGPTADGNLEGEGGVSPDLVGRVHMLQAA